MAKIIFLLCVLLKSSLIACEFVFPKITLEAYTPKGFRATIPETEGIKLFAFHGNRNKPLPQIQPGEFSKDVIDPKINGWSYFDPDLKLEVGDKIYFWVFIQYGQFGYRKDQQQWKVEKLLPLPTLNQVCDISDTEVKGQIQICQKRSIFESRFTRTPIDSEWDRDHFIPTSPDYEFCSYQRSNDTVTYVDNKLVITAVPMTKDTDVKGTLDLRNGCTARKESQCLMAQEFGYILPPAKSARMKSKFAFKYGTVEVKAKLPRGDWLYPEIYLESSTSSSRKIWIAYSRGNERLVGNGGDDLGGTILFGGPVLNATEPGRSQYLSSILSRKVFGSEFHTYKVIWAPSKLTVYVDDDKYGETGEYIASFFNEPMHLVLGIGVGGATNFPDNYFSSNNKKKPWTNYHRLQFKSFFNARNDWTPTWTEGRNTLTVEHVKIMAL